MPRRAGRDAALRPPTITAMHFTPRMIGSGLAAALAVASGTAAAAPAEYAPDRVIVEYAASADGAARRAARRDVGAVGAERLTPRTSRFELMRLPPGTTPNQAMADLQGDPDVVRVEKDYLLRPAATSNDTYFTAGGLWGMYGPATSPSNQWGSNAATAWANGFAGSPAVHVGIIDTGVQITHPDLADNIWVNPGEIPSNGIDDDGNGYVDDVNGWDFYNDNASVYDGPDDDHGTHVAGTIGAPRNGSGVVGVNWDVTMIPAKFLGPSGGWTSDAVRAVDYITDLKSRHGVNVVATNNSWGGGGYSTSLLGAIRRGGDAGILFVAAAGNGDDNGNPVDNDLTPHYPSNYDCSLTAGGSARGWDCVISVASITSTGVMSSFSNYGATSVDLGAPGSAIRSTVPVDTWSSYSGTSMATPHVAGAIALCAASNPALTASAARSAVMSTAVPTASLSGKTVTAARLDAGALRASASCRGVPAMPTGVAASAPSAQATDVTFGIPSDGGSPLTGFTATCTSGDGGATRTAGGPASPITVSSLSKGASYTCRATAENAAGSSSPSIASSAISVPTTVPGAPTSPGNAGIHVRAERGVHASRRRWRRQHHCIPGHVHEFHGGCHGQRRRGDVADRGGWPERRGHLCVQRRGRQCGGHLGRRDHGCSRAARAATCVAGPRSRGAWGARRPRPLRGADRNGWRHMRGAHHGGSRHRRGPERARCGSRRVRRQVGHRAGALRGGGEGHVHPHRGRGHGETRARYATGRVRQTLHRAREDRLPNHPQRRVPPPGVHRRRRAHPRHPTGGMRGAPVVVVPRCVPHRAERRVPAQGCRGGRAEGADGAHCRMRHPCTCQPAPLMPRRRAPGIPHVRCTRGGRQGPGHPLIPTAWSAAG